MLRRSIEFALLLACVAPRSTFATHAEIYQELIRPPDRWRGRGVGLGDMTIRTDRVDRVMRKG
jgi:hypothetical protein